MADNRLFDLSGWSSKSVIAGPQRTAHIRAMMSSDPGETRLREQQRNAAIFKRKLAEECGGMLGAAEVQMLLGLATSEALCSAVADREVLAVKDDSAYRFPAVQFNEGKVRPGIIDVLKAAPNMSGWRLLQYLLYADEGLAGDKPIDLIRGTGDDIERAVRFARCLED